MRTIFTLILILFSLFGVTQEVGVHFNLESFGTSAVVFVEDKDDLYALEESWCKCTYSNFQIHAYSDGKTEEYYELEFRDSTLIDYKRYSRISEKGEFVRFDLVSKETQFFTYDTVVRQHSFIKPGWNGVDKNKSTGLSREYLLNFERNLVLRAADKIHEALTDSLRQAKVGFGAYHLIELNDAVINYTSTHSDLFADDVQSYDSGYSYHYETKHRFKSENELKELVKDEEMQGRILYSAILHKQLYLKTGKQSHWEAYYFMLKAHWAAISFDPINYWALYYDD